MTETRNGELPISQPKIVQGCMAIRDAQDLVSIDPCNQNNVDKLKALEKELREAILAAGGKEGVDAWLMKNDPGNGLLREIEGINWGFLTEE